MLPLSRAADWSSVRMAAPFIGLGNGEIVIMTPAFSPSLAGPWKWAAVAVPVRPQ